MDYELEIDQDAGFVTARLFGARRPASLLQAAAEVTTSCRERGIFRVLIIMVADAFFRYREVNGVVVAVLGLQLLYLIAVISDRIGMGFFFGAVQGVDLGANPRSP